jgi:hypothetical protein
VWFDSFAFGAASQMSQRRQDLRLAAGDQDAKRRGHLGAVG